MAATNPTTKPSPDKQRQDHINMTMLVYMYTTSWRSVRWRRGTPQGKLDSWSPHSPAFPSNELLPNVENWRDCGICPTKWLSDRFREPRKVRLVSSSGISPESWLQDRSSDSKSVMLPSWDGIFPVKALCDKLRTRSDTRLPNVSAFQVWYFPIYCLRSQLLLLYSTSFQMAYQSPCTWSLYNIDRKFSCISGV